MNYRIHPERTDYIELYSKTTIDFRNDIELINLLKTYKKVIYNCPCPLEWLPDEVIEIDVRDIYIIDKIHCEIIICQENTENTENLDGNYNYYDDIELINQITKYKKVIYYDDKSVDWLPEGITHLGIINCYFNHPLENLPQSLIYLFISGKKLFYRESVFRQSLDYLPTGLKCLRLEALCYKIPLDNLPPNLEYLFILQSDYKLPLNNLPQTLKILFVMKFIVFEYNYIDGIYLIPDEYKLYNT